MFRSFTLAGFECGLVHGGCHDLLRSTGHTPERRMREHYRHARDHGLLSGRDGLVPGHDVVGRLRIAREEGVEMVWDLSHYHRIDDPSAYATSVAQAAYAVHGDAPLWLCPVNEPSLYPFIARIPRHEAIDTAIAMARAAYDNHPSVRILTNDPIVGIGERQFEATDHIVNAVHVDVVGVNYYPHTARTTLSKVLLKTWRRYGKPVMVSETSWHDGHRVHHARYPGFDKGRWMRHVLDEVRIAQDKGVVVAGVCWYPIVDCPPWHAPRSRNRWSHGLIRADMSVDPALSMELRAQLLDDAA
ncbi:glycosyl hydrolase 53 family protein [Rhizobium sp. CFBP 8762]|uniref:glycosyl hydrolase 53 family protein n=1 Tax=Rhizobium sp. CFBP 8762 TaxID=2775279 RepID=UPI00177E8AFD|nr:glycosyl hydrolase 53 family protein [Rhizobium sp. CFBP 8762]MBD8555918.1 glycosyl hydrolase 53 family protein [Rhizobium sp. CFBP 8762]